MAKEWVHLVCPTVMKPQRINIERYTHNTHTQKKKSGNGL